MLLHLDYEPFRDRNTCISYDFYSSTPHLFSPPPGGGLIDMASRDPLDSAKVKNPGARKSAEPAGAAFQPAPPPEAAPAPLAGGMPPAPPAMAAGAPPVPAVPLVAVLPAVPARNRRYRVLESKYISLHGAMTVLAKGFEFDEWGYGVDRTRRVLESGVKVEEITVE